MAADALITVDQAYRAMFTFLHSYWERGGRVQEDIATLLGSIQFGEKAGPSQPLDPAQWNDWLDAVKAVQQ